MIEIYGKRILTSLGEMLSEKTRVALLVIDMQNDFVSKKGLCAANSKDISMIESIVAPLSKLVSFARDIGLMIVYTRNVMRTLGDRCVESAAHLAFSSKTMKSEERPPLLSLEGTWGSEIVDKLKPTDRDMVIIKNRSSAFYSTNLDSLLRSNEIQTLLVTGCLTEGCVESTIRDGEFRDYYVIAVVDCIGSMDRRLHEAAMEVIKARWFWTISPEVEKMLSGNSEVC